MRWLLILLLVSVAALLMVSARIAHHIWRERTERKRLAAGRGHEAEIETEEAP